jgi:hypothetical protein
MAGETIFVCAVKGGGKSRRCVDFICDELEGSERSIFTNLPVRLPEFQLWANQHIKHKSVCVPARIRILKDEEVWRFYLLTKDYGKTVPLKSDVTGTEVPDLAVRQGDGGIMFIIDEAQNYFRTRQWAKMGADVDFYLSQSRKLNDSLIVITQHPEKIAVDFRRNATNWIYVENFRKRKMFLGVTLPGRFGWAEYLDQPTKNDKPNDTGHFNLKHQNRHELYDTMAGVGLLGKVGAESNRRVGLHWAVWPAFVAVILVGAWFIPQFMVHGFTGFVRHLTGATTAKVASLTNAKGPAAAVPATNQNQNISGQQSMLSPSEAPQQAGAVNSGTVGPVSPSPKLGTVPSLPQQTNLSCLGWARVPGGGYVAFLDDGDTLEGNEIQVVNRRFVLGYGKVFPVHRGHAEGGFSPAPSESVYGANFTHAGSLSVSVVGQKYQGHQPIETVPINSLSQPSSVVSGTYGN